jgi:hypothetical protein
VAGALDGPSNAEGFMTKNHILSEIRRTAAENGGVPLGKDRFSAATGIRTADWHGKYWARWGDAIREAGFQPNQLSSALPEDYLLKKLADLTRELGHFPVYAEMRLKARSDPGFPSHTTIAHLGAKPSLAAKLRAFCIAQGQNDIAALCAVITEPASEPEQEIEAASNIMYGFVYLMKSGRYYKIERTDALGRREWELKIAVPDKVQTIYSIRTDDPKGIEKYWHERFKERHKNGEWFELSAQDVAAFKRRKFM